MAAVGGGLPHGRLAGGWSRPPARRGRQDRWWRRRRSGGGDTWRIRPVGRTAGVGRRDPAHDRSAGLSDSPQLWQNLLSPLER